MKFFTALVLVVLFALPPCHGNAQTRETWRSVRTNNLFVIGNTDAEKLRQVSVWLEFFHGAFARLISRNVLDSSVPTTVVVFRDDASFEPFKPLYQGKPANVAGYFQPGEDVNYIAITLDPSVKDPFSTAFHEYIHVHVNESIPAAPLWLNEGLAEFYGSLQFTSGEAVLGTPLTYYLRLLRQQEPLPLTTLFSIGTSSEHYNEADKTGIFYGESWALVHYLMLSDRGTQEQFKRFLQLVTRGESSAKAIESAYGVTLASLEPDFRAYIRRGELSTLRIASADNPDAYTAFTATQRTSLSESEANYYLGDLLLHIGRANDAESYFKQAIALDPGFAPANKALGLLYVQQRRYADAKKYLDKAVSSPQDYLTHYLYAYVLSREGLTPTGGVKEYTPANAAAMREHLLRAIKLAPNYAAAYYLVAFVDLVQEERLDEAMEMAQRARQLEPAKAGAALLLIAQIHMVRGNNAAAREILEPLTHDSNQPVKSEAQELLESLDQNRGPNQSTASPVSSAMIAEPVPTGTARVLGGSSGGVAINDGQTIQTSGALPSVDELLNKYVEALGGAAAFKAITSRVIKGTVDIPGVSRGGSFEGYQQAPNKLLTVMQAYPVGTVKVGFNGQSAWTSTSAGVRVLKGKELEAIERESDFYTPLKLKSLYKKVTVAGTSKIGYRDVYVLDCQSFFGPLDRYYLDVKTYLPARVNTLMLVGSVLAPVEMYFDDWRPVDGIKMPFSTTQRFPKMTLSYTVTEVKHNAPIDANIFEPPH